MLSEARHQPPRFRNILGGAIAFGLLLAMIWQFSAVFKSFGYLLLYLPAQVGVVRQATSQDIHQLQADGWASITVAAPGAYHVYLDSYDVLKETDAALLAGKNPWLRVQEASTDEALAVSYVTRGLSLYDTPYAGGRPAFTVDFPRTGEYRVSARKTAPLWLVPDYVTAYETTLTLAIFTELVVLAVLCSGIWYWTHRQRFAARQLQRRRDGQRHVHAEAFWQREGEQRTKSDD